jgi:hypothetical protein
MRRTVRPVVGAVLSACLLAALPAAAQEPVARVPFEGSHAFRHLLNLAKLQPLQRVTDLAGVSPRETVLIVFGDTRTLPEALQAQGGLKQFHDRGGAILIASDRPDQLRLEPLKVAVSGNAVGVPFKALVDKPSPVYKGSTDCPVVRDFGDNNHPLFAGVRKGIATNRPSYLLRLSRSDLRLLATLPPQCQDENTLRRGLRWRWPLAFIFGTSPAADRPAPLVVIAGHGVFMNGMLGQADNDNWTFARNCVRWLTHDGKRKHALFLENGTVVQSFDVPLVQLPVPPLKAMYGLVRELEEENFFNRLLLENVDRTQLLMWLLLGISAPFLLYVLARLVGAHHRGAGKTPLVAACAAEAVADLPAVAQRQEHVLEEGNCWEAARDLARLCFEGHPGGDVTAAPPVAVRGGRRLRRDVERLWRLAYGEPLPVAPEQFAGLLRALARVRAALDDGALRWVPQAGV